MAAHIVRVTVIDSSSSLVDCLEICDSVASNVLFFKQT